MDSLSCVAGTTGNPTKFGPELLVYYEHTPVLRCAV